MILGIFLVIISQFGTDATQMEYPMFVQRIYMYGGRILVIKYPTGDTKRLVRAEVKPFVLMQDAIQSGHSMRCLLQPLVRMKYWLCFG
jgi:hypothetical protein